MSLSKPLLCARQCVLCIDYVMYFPQPILWDKYCYYPHWTEKATKAVMVLISCSRWYSKLSGRGRIRMQVALILNCNPLATKLPCMGSSQIQTFGIGITLEVSYVVFLAHLSNAIHFIFIWIRFLYEYSRRHPEYSVSLLLRLAKEYEATLEKCCATDDPPTCYSKVVGFSKGNNVALRLRIHNNEKGK